MAHAEGEGEPQDTDKGGTVWGGASNALPGRILTKKVRPKGSCEKGGDGRQDFTKAFEREPHIEGRCSSQKSLRDGDRAVGKGKLMHRREPEQKGVNLAASDRTINCIKWEGRQLLPSELRKKGAENFYCVLVTRNA